MLYTGSNVYVADNSGGYIARLIKLVSRPHYRWGVPGDVFLVTCKKIRPNRRVKKGELYRALITNARSPFRRPGGQTVTFNQNNAVILKKDDVIPLASRIRTATPLELRARGFRRILTMSAFNL